MDAGWPCPKPTSDSWGAPRGEREPNLKAWPSEQLCGQPDVGAVGMVNVNQALVPRL